MRTHTHTRTPRIPTGIVWVQCMLGIDEGAKATCLLCLCNDVKCERRLATALRPVDLCDSTTWKTTDTQRHIQSDTASRYHLLHTTPGGIRYRGMVAGHITQQRVRASSSCTCGHSGLGALPPPSVVTAPLPNELSSSRMHSSNSEGLMLSPPAAAAAAAAAAALLRLPSFSNATRCRWLVSKALSDVAHGPVAYLHILVSTTGHSRVASIERPQACGIERCASSM